MRVLFTGGGTGGHLYPAVAIADMLRDVRDAEVLFVGTADRLEARIVPEAGYALETVCAEPLRRSLSPALLRTIAVNAQGVLAAMRVLRRFRPDIVIATGGYVCAPVVAAAYLLRVRPIVLFEPNATPGLTNRLIAPLVDEVWSAFDAFDARATKKVVTTGIPVRATIRRLPPRDVALVRLGLATQRKTLLAIGGSQGARSINDALAAIVQDGSLPENWQLIHVTGEREYDRVRAAIGQSASSGALRPYLSDMSDAYAAADLVLARSGASTLGELAALGKPAVLVPYPHAADDHQRANALAFARGGGAVVVDDANVVAGRLPETLAAITSTETFDRMAAAARSAGQGDPLATILARVDALLSRTRP